MAALDNYAAAWYWQAIHGTVAHPVTVQCLITARSNGVSEEQLADARIYIQKCVLNGRRPLCAGSSFPAFKERMRRERQLAGRNVDSYDRLCDITERVGAILRQVKRAEKGIILDA